MPTLLALAGAKGSPDHPFDGKDMWATIADGAPVAARGHPDQRRSVPRRRPQGRLEADQDRAAAGQDAAVQSRQGPGRDDRRRRRQSRDREGSEGAPDGLREGAEAEPVDQGAARLRRQSGQDGLRPGFRHRRRRRCRMSDRAAGEVIRQRRPYNRQEATVNDDAPKLSGDRDVGCLVMARRRYRRGRHCRQGCSAPRQRVSGGSGSTLPFRRFHRRASRGPALAGVEAVRRAEPNALKPDAPNVLIILLDDVGFGLPTLRRRDPHADADAPRRHEGIATTPSTPPRSARRPARRC